MFASLFTSDGVPSQEAFQPRSAAVCHTLVSEKKILLSVFSTLVQPEVYVYVFYSVLMQICSDYVLGGRHLILCLKPIPQNNEAFFSVTGYISTSQH